jgi:hypothetical protein
VLRPAEGWLAVGGSPAAREALGKALREQGAPPPNGALARVSPAGRSLQIGSQRYEI